MLKIGDQVATSGDQILPLGYGRVNSVDRGDCVVLWENGSVGSWPMSTLQLIVPNWVREKLLSCFGNGSPNQDDYPVNDANLYSYLSDRYGIVTDYAEYKISDGLYIWFSWSRGQKWFVKTYPIE